MLLCYRKRQENDQTIEVFNDRRDNAVSFVKTVFMPSDPPLLIFIKDLPLHCSKNKSGWNIIAPFFELKNNQLTEFYQLCNNGELILKPHKFIPDYWIFSA